MAVRINKSHLNDDQIKTIRKFLYIQPKTSFFQLNSLYSNPKDPILFYIIDNNDILLPYTFFSALTKTLPNRHIKYPEKSFDFKGSLLDRQKSVIPEAIHQLETHGTTLLVLPPGFGKTVIGSFLSSITKKLTLVLYPRTLLESQWFNTFIEFTTAKLWIIGHPQPNDFDVILSMDTQFHKIPSTIKSQIGTIIIDEAHMFCTPTHVTCLLGTEPLFIIALTATPNRDDGLFSMIESIIGLHKVYRKHENPFNVIRFLTGIKPIVKTNFQGNTDWNALINDLCNNETRNAYILTFVQQNPDSKILILTWRVEHATQLYNWLKLLNESVAILAGPIKSYSDSRILVGTVSKIGTGFDEKSACPDFSGKRINMLIWVGSSKSEIIIEQTIGRAFRSDFPTIIAFIDDNKSIKNHWYILKKWCLNRNAYILDFKPPLSPVSDSFNTKNIFNITSP